MTLSFFPFSSLIAMNSLQTSYISFRFSICKLCSYMTYSFLLCSETIGMSWDLHQRTSGGCYRGWAILAVFFGFQA